MVREIRWAFTICCDGSWHRRSPDSRSVVSQDGYVTADGRRRLVIARPAKPPYDTAFSHALFDRLETIRRERAATAPRANRMTTRPPLDVQFAGGHRIALEAEAVVKRESIINGAGSLALILPLLLVVFRSLRLVAIGALPSALSFLIVLGVARLRRRDALGCRGGRVGDVVWTRRGRRRAAVCHAPSCARADTVTPGPPFAACRRRQPAWCSGCGRRRRRFSGCWWSISQASSNSAC